MAVSSRARGQTAESPAPHGDEAGGRDREVERGGRSEGTGRGGNVEEFGQVKRGKVMEGVECKQEDFEVYTEFDREPVELLHNRGNVVNARGSGDDPSCRVLNHLKFM